MLNKQKGQDISEWGFVLVLVAIVVMMILSYIIGPNVTNIVNTVINSLQQVNNTQNP